MSELIRPCPECHHETAVHLGDVDGLALYSCGQCDAEFRVEVETEGGVPD